MLSKSIFFLSIVVLLVHHPIANCKQQLQSSEDYIIYSALIEQMYIKEGIQLIVIQSPTQSYQFDHRSEDEHLNYVVQYLSPVTKTTFQDFLKKNQEPINLENQFLLRTAYVLLKKDELQNFFKLRPGVVDSLYEAWQEFYKKYPQSPGYIMISRIGYNPEKTQAVVYVGLGCGSLCGKGQYVLLTKENDQWKVKNELHLWVS